MTKLAVVTPRYHESVVGGAELHARWLSQRLAGAGHDVHIFTTGAVDALTWRNDLPMGESQEDGLTVRRYPADRPLPEVRGQLDQRMRKGEHLGLGLEERWLRAGPNSRALEQDLSRRGSGYGAVMALPYLAGSTYFAFVACPDRFFLIPCLHDEPFARAEFTRRLFGGARAVLFNSEPERLLAERLLPGQLAPSAVIGLGFDAPGTVDPGGFLRKYGVKAPFAVYMGRLEQDKNVPLLIKNFLRYKVQRPGRLQLLLVGSGDAEPPPSPHIRRLSIDWADRDSMLAAATFLFQPSIKESLSIVMMQAWASGLPVVAHAEGDVSRWHCERSNGGLWFANYPEFELIVDRITAEPELRGRLGEAGRRYVAEQYGWDRVLDRFEAVLEAQAGREVPDA